MNRPVVESPLGTKLCRPSEEVLELLPVAKLPPFTSLELFETPTQEKLTVQMPSRHPPRFLMLYGSLRERS